MKKFVTAVMLLSLLCSLIIGTGSGSAAAALTVPKLYLNGERLQTPVDPRFVGQYTFVPVRIVSESLGFNVEWAGKNVNISNGSNKIVLTLSSKTAVVNDREVTLDAPPFADKNTTLVPLRFVSQQLGLSVYWEKETQSVHMSQQEPPKSPEEGSDSTGSGETGQNPGDAGALGTLNSINFDGTSGVDLWYSGEISKIETEVLHNTERFVIDLRNTVMDGILAANLENGQSSIATDTHPSFTGIRYSNFKDKPTTVRIVLDFTVETPVNVVQENGHIRLDILEPGSVVVPPPVTAPGKDKPSTGKFKVVIDAGHGGKAPGASAINGKKEKEFTLALVLKIKALLDKEPQIQPYLTREDDTSVELMDRAKFANDLGADIFVSIHGNSATPSASGTETWYTRDNSKALAEVLQKHLIKATGLKDRKVKTAGLVVTKYTTMPAVLLEVGFLSNKTDVEIMFSEEKQNEIAREIVAGIKEYLKVS
ncbi:N-acetylmuramoyl-L-alanine amidase [Paenibacillus sp. GCM10027626]|uniref:N-acetylmuramoyl-L-alanine amidase n=1 Tax=Paenibacillus sp. GCM10027626 TaxID=3273411 RepID=UPI00362C6879